MQYIIAPIGEEKNAFSLNSAHLVERIRATWVEANVTLKEDNSLVSWKILMDKYPLVGEFWHDKKMVVLDADQINTARFALWYRSIVPSNQRLWIFDDLGNDEPYEIRTDTSQEQIIQALT